MGREEEPVDDVGFERSEHFFGGKFNGQKFNVAVAAWTVILQALLSN